MNEQHETLYQWFKISLGDSYIKDDKAKVLLNLFTTNQSYTADFWTVTDKKGESPLHWLLKEANVSLKPFLQCVNSSSVAHSVFNTPNSEGRVLLHDLWSKYEKNPTDGTIHEILQVLEKTDHHHWTFWDSEGQHPGEGWANQVLKQQSSSSGASNLNTLSQKIMEVFPPMLNKDPNNSPWLTVKSSSQIQTLLDAGYTLQDTVSINGWEQPAWRILCICHGKHIFSKSILDGFKAEEITELKEIEDGFKDWEVLAPHDRRAKIGYVRQVMSKTGGDPSGKSSLVYLLEHRPDLLALLHRELIYSDQNAAVEHLAQTDCAGYTLLANAVFKGFITEVAALYQSFNMPFKLGCEPEGLFAHEKKSSLWVQKALNKRSNCSIVSTRNLQKLLLLTKDPLMLFGEEEQQKILVREWDVVLARLPSLTSIVKHKSTYGSPKITSEDEYYIRQALLFLDNQELIAPKILPELASQLKLAGMWAKSMPGVAENWTIRSEVNNVRMDLVEPPEHCTPGMNVFMKKDGIAHIFRAAYTKTDLIERWSNALQRATLINTIEESGALEVKSIQRRKM